MTHKPHKRKKSTTYKEIPQYWLGKSPCTVDDEGVSCDKVDADDAIEEGRIRAIVIEAIDAILSEELFITKDGSMNGDIESKVRVTYELSAFFTPPTFRGTNARDVRKNINFEKERLLRRYSDLGFEPTVTLLRPAYPHEETQIISVVVEFDSEENAEDACKYFGKANLIVIQKRVNGKVVRTRKIKSGGRAGLANGQQN